MKTLVTVRKLTGAMLAGVLLMLFGNAANALTASGTSITNSATVNYSVNAVVQSAITSSAATFVVDKELLLAVAKVDASKVIVTPGQATVAVLTYSVTNSGNSTEDVKLSNQHDAGAADPFGGGQADNFTPTATTTTMYVDTNANGVYDAGTDTAVTSLSTLAAGASKTIFIVFSGGTVISAAQVDGDVSVYGLIGQLSTSGSCATSCVAETQDTTTDKNANLNTVYNVFADTVAGPDDAVRDGKSSARDALLVKSAKLAITKSAKVISDPINGVDNGTTIHARSIPGAVMQYTITVSNASTATQSATGVAISDSLASQIGSTTTWKVGLLTVTSPAGTINPCEDDGAGKTTTAGVSCDYNFTASKTVTVSGITLAANQTATITYEVTIN